MVSRIYAYKSQSLQKLAQQIEIGVVNKPNNLVKLFFKILL
jgi:hypothetical protein